MKPETFASWLSDMKSEGRIKSDADAGRMLGVTPETIVNYKTRGAPPATALACSALLGGIAAYQGK